MNINQDRKICKKCVLPESKPDIWLNGEGVCNVCVDYENTNNNSIDERKAKGE